MLCPPGSLDGENNDECISRFGKGSKKEPLLCVFYLYCVYRSSEFSCCSVVRCSLKIMEPCAGHAHVPARNGKCCVWHCPNIVLLAGRFWMWHKEISAWSHTEVGSIAWTGLEYGSRLSDCSLYWPVLLSLPSMTLVLLWPKIFTELEKRSRGRFLWHSAVTYTVFIYCASLTRMMW